MPQEPGQNLKSEEPRDEGKAPLPSRGASQAGLPSSSQIHGRRLRKNAQLPSRQPASSPKHTATRKGVSQKDSHGGGERPFHCSLCSKTYRDASGLSRHRRAHMNYRPHSCPVCGKRFRDRSEVKRHQKIHQKKGPVLGNQASTGKIPATAGFPAPSFRRQQPIQRPVDATHRAVVRTKAPNSRAVDSRANPPLVRRARRKVFSCPLCPLTFIKKTYLSSHQKVHFTEQPYHCFCCGECFSSSFILAQHQQIHWKEKIYCCPVCDVCFEGKEALLGHLGNKRKAQDVGKPPKCWEALGYLVGYFYDPLTLQRAGNMDESSGEGKDGKVASQEDKGNTVDEH
ncbi:zinc finger protein 57 homolog [Nannospalax galili]|uniref:zinc finger protein 57 homolog n=1 Tax=Nannospalax galili TaxID=1026970 RepID=UPI0004ED3E78|nr:zinc finger protein 57 homolog [Nannospalax galili]